MRLTPSDPDIETLIGRIKSKEIDLQPEFQRGEVWATPKKQRLIDSILRDWHIPPIHMVLDSDSQKQSVLDGQQRLVAIRDFANNRFSVDGGIEPYDPEVSALAGLTYDELPAKWKRRFDQFTIRVFRITDYAPSEPGELFYRLNQPSALTAAEQRNAFFGNVRADVKRLVSEMESNKLHTSFWGFSNARMAYDDVVARTCMILDNNTLKKKVSSADLADQYRSDRAFGASTVKEVSAALALLSSAREFLNITPKLNKATSQSWLIFIACLIRKSIPVSPSSIAGFINEFEMARVGVARNELGSFLFGGYAKLDKTALVSVIRVYDDRSTSRVADTTSVTLRDFVLWFCFVLYSHQINPLLKSQCFQWKEIEKIFDQYIEIISERDVEELANGVGWGEIL